MTTPPIIEFAFPGPLRDRLVEAVLDGSKTSTTGLVEEYALDDEPLPYVGQQQTVIDSQGMAVGFIETTEVRVVRLADVDEQHARDEGEGFTTVAEWRSAHEEFWHSPEMREAMGDMNFTVGDDTLVILERFQIISSAGS